jgi:hypothetical protein
VLYELSEDPNPFYSFEFFYMIEDTNDKTGDLSFRGKVLEQNAISIKHQVLILAGVVYFIKFLWFLICSKFS